MYNIQKKISASYKVITNFKNNVHLFPFYFFCSKTLCFAFVKFNKISMCARVKREGADTERGKEQKGVC